jgi:cobalt-zinc-cadmium efflux system protein
VSGVHDLHVWSISQGLRTLSAHVVTDDVTISAGARIQAAVSQLLGQEYGINHATLQLECAGCVQADLYCDIAANNHH